MKKYFVIALVSLMAFFGVGCGNQDIFDTVYTYDYAIVKFPDGETKKIELQSWTDYEGEQIQITAKDGTTYLVSSMNCVLVSEN